MKAFEKWKSDNCEENCIEYPSHLCATCEGLGSREDVWKAALKWANEGLNKFHIEEELENK